MQRDNIRRWTINSIEIFYWTKCKYKLTCIIQKGCTPCTAYASVLQQLLKDINIKKNNYISVDDEGKLCTSDLHIVLSFTMTKEFICNCIFSFFAIMQFGLTFHYCFWNNIFFSLLNATLDNISVLSWQPALLLEETEVPGENHRPAASHWQTLSHYVVSSTPRLSGIGTHNIGGDMHWLHR